MKKKRQNYKTILITMSMVICVCLGSYAAYGIISQRIFHLVSGTEYMDKTFIYSIKDTVTSNLTRVVCAEKDAPTYDTKKGLMTWVDYKSYQLEEIFDTNTSRHIRAILTEAGPEKDRDQVVTRLKETLGMVDLTYDEVISAMQYAIWYYSDNDFRIPSTSNGEDLYKHFVSLEGVSSNLSTDFISISVDSVERKSKDIVIQYHYSGNSKVNIEPSYSMDIKSIYKAKETIKLDGDRTSVILEIPITANELKIDFDIIVGGTIKEANQYAAFVPDERGSAQILVGYLKQEDLIAADSKRASVHYQAYELTLNDDGDIVKKGFSEGTTVTIDMINELNPTGKQGYTFDGWYEGSTQVTKQIIMNKNRRLDAKYSSSPSTPGNGGNPGGGGTPGTGDNPSGGGTPGTGDNPGGGGTPGTGDNPSGNDTPTVAKDPDEPIPDDPVPQDVPSLITTITSWPKTGGVPLLVFMVCGSISISIGILMKRQK